MDLNADLGESYGRWRLGDDANLVRHLTSANVACGFHAGDFMEMERSVSICLEAGVAVGAQPGYPDLLGFGRRPLPFSPEEVEALVRYQVGALEAFCRARGVAMQHVKPHGALYNQAAADPALAGAIARAVARFDSGLALFGLAGSPAMADAARAEGLRLVPEAFADRRYRSDGSLVPRSEAGAVIGDPAAAAEQALRIAVEGSVEAIDGTPVRVHAETICCHGDTPGAVEIAAAVRARLETAGVAVAAIGTR